VESVRASATPNSDIDIRIPTANSAISTSNSGSDAPSDPPNGASVLSARRLLIANTAPMIAGSLEWSS